MNEYVFLWLTQEAVHLAWTIGIFIVLCLLWALVYTIAEFIGRWLK